MRFNLLPHLPYFFREMLVRQQPNRSRVRISTQDDSIFVQLALRADGRVNSYLNVRSTVPVEQFIKQHAKQTQTATCVLATCLKGLFETTLLNSRCRQPARQAYLRQVFASLHINWLALGILRRIEHILVAIRADSVRNKHSMETMWTVYDHFCGHHSGRTFNSSRYATPL